MKYVVHNYGLLEWIYANTIFIDYPPLVCYAGLSPATLRVVLPLMVGILGWPFLRTSSFCHPGLRHPEQQDRLITGYPGFRIL